MKFRNYCLVVMGDTVGVLSEIEKISETTPNFVDAKGIVLATFSSVVKPRELNDWFRLNRRSFLVFELDPETCGFNITKTNVHEGLFGFLKTFNVEDKSAELLREIKMTSDTVENSSTVKFVSRETKVIKPKVSLDDINKMTKTERENLWNKIIDNGIDNLTDEDKKILQILSEK